jgi:hypothetical protein
MTSLVDLLDRLLYPTIPTQSAVLKGLKSRLNLLKIGSTITPKSTCTSLVTCIDLSREVILPVELFVACLLLPPFLVLFP